MDKKYLLAFGMGAASLALGILVVRLVGIGTGLPPVDPPENIDPPRRVANVSGPYIHKNLTVYLVRGQNTLTGKTPLTLEEAMDRKLVRVHETSDVNELEIENISRTEEVFVQAGDIVKGGRQDRVLSVDLIVPAMSGRMPISSFCVEHGRWTARGEESPAEFNSASERVPSKDLKVAAMHSNSQAAVWENVEKSQAKLSAAANTNVASSASRSSLQLSLENEKVRSNAGEYIDALREIVDGKNDVIGFVFALNGEVNSGDTYGSSELFVKLWPKLLKAAAIEAVAEKYDSKAAENVMAADISSFLADGVSARLISTDEVTDRVRITKRESRRVAFTESEDAKASGWLHRSYIAR